MLRPNLPVSSECPQCVGDYGREQAQMAENIRRVPADYGGIRKKDTSRTVQWVRDCAMDPG